MQPGYSKYPRWFYCKEGKTLKKAQINLKSNPKKVLVRKKTSNIRTAYTKSETIKAIAAKTGMNKSQIISVLEAFEQVVEEHIQESGPGYFTWPGLLKVETVVKPATPAKQRINPFTGKKTLYRAQPAKKTVKIKALKKLKDVVQEQTNS